MIKKENQVQQMTERLFENLKAKIETVIPEPIDMYNTPEGARILERVTEYDEIERRRGNSPT